MKSTRKARRDARHLYQLCLVDGRLDPGRTRQVAERMATSGRRESLAILENFERLVRLDRDRQRAVVATALALPEDLQASVRTRLIGRYGTGLELTFEEDPALIAGMRVRVGSDVYDGSVRAQLARLEARV